MHYSYRFIELIVMVLFITSCNDEIMITRPDAQYVPTNEECVELENYTLIEDICYYQPDLEGLIKLIEVAELNIAPLELGLQTWESTRLTLLEFVPGTFDTIPKEIGNLSSLKRLSLYDNQLTGSIPEAFCNIKYHLTYYNFNENNLCFPWPTCLEIDNVGNQNCSE